MGENLAGITKIAPMDQSIIIAIAVSLLILGWLLAAYLLRKRDGMTVGEYDRMFNSAIKESDIPNMRRTYRYFLTLDLPAQTREQLANLMMDARNQESIFSRYELFAWFLDTLRVVIYGATQLPLSTSQRDSLSKIQDFTSKLNAFLTIDSPRG